MIDKNKIVPISVGTKKHVKCSNMRDVKIELLSTLDDTLLHIKNQKCMDAVQYIIWNDFLNENGTLAPKSNDTFKRYVWGEKVFVDYGISNIQTELAYPHPSVILYNFANTVIVVPTTTDDKVTKFTSDIEDCVIKVKGDGTLFKNDSIINLHQIKAIHKKRIIKSLNCNIKNFILDKDEVDRLNNLESYKFFEYDKNLLINIQIKLNTIFNKSTLEDIYEKEAYSQNDKINMLSKIAMLEEEINNYRETIKEASLTKTNY